MIYLILFLIMFSFVLTVSYIENEDNNTLQKIVVTLIWLIINLGVVYTGVLYVFY